MAAPFTTANSFGYGPSVDEKGLAAMDRYFGCNFPVVKGPSDWKVSIVTGSTRTISIAPGEGFGYFILDRTLVAHTIGLAAAATADRWDLVTVRRDWSPETPGGETSFHILPGAATGAVANPRPVGYANTPGVLADQPLALVRIRANQPLPQEIIELRMTASKMLRASHLLALDPDAPLGSRVEVAGREYVRDVNAQGALEWQQDDDYREYTPAWVSSTAATGIGTGGALVGTYRRDGDHVSGQWAMTMGGNGLTGGVPGTDSSWYWTLPTKARLQHPTLNNIGRVQYKRAADGGVWRGGTMHRHGGIANGFIIVADGQSREFGTLIPAGGAGWQAGDTIRGQFDYEVEI
jgi:hypothetical protein